MPFLPNTAWLAHRLQKPVSWQAVPLIIHFHGADVYHRDTVADYHDLYQQAFNMRALL
jgi:hypothetical protein